MTAGAVETMEVWELTIPGRVSVTVAGEYGKPRDISARGEGQRLRFTTAQRRIAEEVIRDRVNNPFRNGMLIKINREQLEREERERALAEERVYVPDPRDEPSDDELTDAELIGMFSLSVDDGTFGGAVSALSEINVRRLNALTAKHDAKASQAAFLNEFIRETYAIGGSTPTYDEMQQRPTSAVS